MGNKADAYATYQEATKLALEQASSFNPEMALSTEAINTYLQYESVSPRVDNVTLETICLQKYIYFFQFQPIESYNETRRTGLIPATNQYGRSNRMLYANSKITRNPNTPDNITFFSIFENTTKLVWAK